MDKIGEGLLQEGDVILYNGDSWISKAIRFFDGTEVNHAAVFLGNGRVGEAIGQGLTERSFGESTKGDRYVIVRRLTTQPGTMAPVVQKARAYLAIGNRYAFEQILLLAFLGMTRKVPVNPYLKWLMRKVFDQACEFLSAPGKRQPMICSEYVCRCYNEALPISTDPYTLRINDFPAISGAGRLRGRTDPAAPHRRRMHADSLLAWTEEVLLSPKQLRGDPLVAALEGPKARGAAKPAPADRKMAALAVDTLIEKYLTKTKEPPLRAFDAEADLRDAAMLAAIVTFVRTYDRATDARGAGKEKPEPAGAVGEASEALRRFRETIDNFVTPGDLLKCSDLFHVGKIVMAPKP